jgi:regulatory protein
VGRAITALKLQKRNPNRVNIYLDGQFAFGLARIVAAWLSVGQVLEDAQIQKLLEQDAVEVAYQKALQLLSYRERSEAEVRRRLAESGFEADVVEGVLERLRTAGLVQDDQYARRWVESRSLSRPRGRRALAAELQQKGIAKEKIEQALKDAAPEEDLAYAAACKQARRLQGLPLDTFRARLGGFLARRGFPYDVSAQVIRRVWSELHPVEAEELILEE